MVLTGTKWFGGCGASSSSSGFFVSGMAMLGLRGKLGAELHGWSWSRQQVPPVLLLPIWHQSFLQTVGLGLPLGASGAQRSSPGLWQGRDGADLPPGLSSSLGTHCLGWSRRAVRRPSVQRLPTAFSFCPCGFSSSFYNCCVGFHFAAE